MRDQVVTAAAPLESDTSEIAGSSSPGSLKMSFQNFFESISSPFSSSSSPPSSAASPSAASASKSSPTSSFLLSTSSSSANGGRQVSRSSSQSSSVHNPADQDNDGAKDSHNRSARSPQLEPSRATAAAALPSSPALPPSSFLQRTSSKNTLKRADSSRELASPTTPSATAGAAATTASNGSSTSSQPTVPTPTSTTFGIDFKKITDFFVQFSAKSTPLFSSLRGEKAEAPTTPSPLLLTPSASTLAPQDFVDHIFDEHKGTHAILYSRFDDPYENESQETFPKDIVHHKARDTSYRWYPHTSQMRDDAPAPSLLDFSVMAVDTSVTPSSTFQANAPEFLRRFNRDDNAMPPAAGDVIGSYRLGEVVGIGAFSTVFQGHPLSDPHTRVAIKTTEKTALDPSLLDNIHREISIWRTLDHPNIVKFIDFIDTPNYIYVVCELCEEGCLYDHVINTREGYLSEDEAKPVFVQVMQALNYLHSRGIYHGDIKLDNILLTKSGDVKLCDFGFCERVSDRGALSPEQRSCGGTLLYCAPEVLRGTVEVGCLSDVWSAGVTLFALVTGELPFDDDYEPRLKHQILAGKFSFSPEVSVTPELKSLVSSMLKTNVSERPNIPAILQHKWLAGVV